MPGRALGGADLQGERMTRHVYLDESGTGDIRKEPHVIVAGVVIDPDRHWKPVELRLAELAAKYAINHDPGVPIVFHANDILQCGGGWGPRERYSKAHRVALISELCSIPARFGLPIVTGFVERKAIAEMYPKDSLADQTNDALVLSAVRCTIGVERYMRQRTDAGEVATMIYENNNESKKLIKEVHEALKLQFFSDAPPLQGWQLKDFLPITRVVDTAYFAEKEETSILQVADACAFAIRRFLSRLENGDAWFDLLRDRLTSTIYGYSRVGKS